MFFGFVLSFLANICIPVTRAEALHTVSPGSFYRHRTDRDPISSLQNQAVKETAAAYLNHHKAVLNYSAIDKMLSLKVTNKLTAALTI